MQGHNTVLKLYQHSSDSSRYQERQQLLGNFLTYVALDFYHGIHAVLKSMACKSKWRIQGRGPGGPAPPYFLRKMRPEGRKNFFLETGSPPPLYQGLDDRPPPPPYLKIRIRHESVMSALQLKLPTWCRNMFSRLIKQKETLAYKRTYIRLLV